MRLIAIFVACLALVACSGDKPAQSHSQTGSQPQSQQTPSDSAPAPSQQKAQTASASDTGASNASTGRPTKDLYNRSCVSCHASGAAGAPRTGDTGAWEPRLAKGMDVLMKHTKEGYNAMPPKGMCFDCTDAEFMALIEYMSKPKG